MGVKELVGLYDAGRAQAPPELTSRSDADTHPLILHSGGLSPSPARFLKHPHLRRREPSNTDDPDELDLIPPTALTKSNDLDASRKDADDTKYPEYTTDVTDELPSLSYHNDCVYSREYAQDLPPYRSGANTRSPLGYQRTDAIPLLPLGSGTANLPESRQYIAPIGDGYRDTYSAGISTPIQKHYFSSSTIFVQSTVQPHASHVPVPVKTVFSRTAAPLSLPKLDDYIASLEAPFLPSVKPSGRHKSKDIKMFAPMDRLAASKKSLVDLETNTEDPPWWRDRNTIFSSLISMVLGITGSSAIASLYSIEGFFDTLQLFALILNSLTSQSGGSFENRIRQLILVQIPNVLALNLAATPTQSLVIPVIFMVIAGLLLYYFYRVTLICTTLGTPEGLVQRTFLKNTWFLVLASFMLTVIYLPLSILAVHIVIWSDDLWVIPNPYINATTLPPSPPPLGPADEFRDPMDFCWTTTMKRNEFNYAPLIMILALICVVGLTFWFPIRLYRTIREVTPTVDPYTELGTLRSKSELDREYQRLLNRDTNPLSFLYKGFRRNWGTYRAMYLFVKLTALFITALIDPDNCLFRSLPRTRIEVVRQIVLLAAMLVFFIVQCVFNPCLDPVNNASEFTSRMNYVLTAGVSLAVVLKIPGYHTLDTVVLYIIYFVTYGLSFYFTIIHTGFMRRIAKWLGRRIDFSIDIFSPRVDLSPDSSHLKRRIWQEALTTLFLTTPDCAIPKKQLIEFAQARGDEYPPYLLGFSGSPGERYIENLKIFREVGPAVYNKAVVLVSGPDNAWFRYLEETIQDCFIGPDCYWRSADSPVLTRTKFFGNSWWIPFPPTLVIRYDDGALAILQKVSDLELYVAQNRSPHMQRRRDVRRVLRALDGQVVAWPYDHQRDASWYAACCCRGRYQGTVHYASCTLRVKHSGRLFWQGVDLASGFDVELIYAKNVKVDGHMIGLTDDYDLTPPLARFLAMNQHLVGDKVEALDMVLHGYRLHHKRECHSKAHTLSYKFLASVFDRPQSGDAVAAIVMHSEHDLRVRQLITSNEHILQATYERMLAVSKTELGTWWYIFWDDLWRRNYDVISAMKKHATDFNPHYPTSIAYTPLPRAALESFLTQRGLFHKTTKWGDFFHAGFLNKMYLRMNDIVFHGSNEAIILHLGKGESEFDMEDVDGRTLSQPSTLGTGGGTDQNDSEIRPRPYYRWEGILEDTLRSKKAGHRKLLANVGVWFGVSPRWRWGAPSKGLALDVQLQDGKYVLLDDADYGTLKTSGSLIPKSV